MAQISKGQTFHDTEQVTFQKLNDLVDNSTLQAGAITEQGAISGAVDGADLVLIYDQTATALRKASITEILTSATANITNLTTSNIVGQINSDITLTPNDGIEVTGKSWASVNGILVTVSSTAHGLSTGQVLSFTSSNSAFSGIYKITVTSVDLFTYSISPVSVGSSGTVSYIKLASTKNLGSHYVTGNEYINGDAYVNGTLTVTGTTIFDGAQIIGSVVGNISAPQAPTIGAHLANKTYVDGTVSKLTNGYVTLPNGLIMQWGVGTAGTSTYNSQTITFPIPFPTACLSVQVTSATATTVTSPVAQAENFWQINGPQTSSSFVALLTYSGSVRGNTGAPRWFAIGY